MREKIIQMFRFIFNLFYNNMPPVPAQSDTGATVLQAGLS